MFLFITSYPPKNSCTAFIKAFENSTKKYVNLSTFFVSSRRYLKTKGVSFSKFINNWTLSKAFLKFFFTYFQSRNTYFNEHFLVDVPASTKQKHALGKHFIQTKTPLPPDKNTQLHSFIHITRWLWYHSWSKRRHQCLNAFKVLHFTEAATSICTLKKVFTTCGQKTLEFFQWLWHLTIINFIIGQLFGKHGFLKNICAWLLLTSKFFSEFDSMFWP